MDAGDMTSSPPRLPPVSGVLVAANPSVVRPVAFRASHGGSSSALPEAGSHVADEGSSSNGSVLSFPEDGRRPPAGGCHCSGHRSAPVLEWGQGAAQRWRTAFYPAHASSQGTPPSLCTVFFHQSMPQVGADSRGSRSSSGGPVDGVLDSGHSSALLPEDRTPPSPSDSGIAELEAQLREKDAEIAHLRQTLEQNEQAIIRVYEEKEQAWQRRMEELKSLYEEQLAQQRLQTLAANVCTHHPEEEESWWLPCPSQLDSEVAKLTTLMTGHEVPQLRLELRRCRRHLQLALQSFREERQARQGSHGQSRDLLRALSRVQLLDGWSESSC
ncbi:unnamed protein product [Ixodes pacificus]